MKHLLGSQNPVDFNSRHPTPMNGWNQDVKKQMFVDEGEDIDMSIFFSDLPEAVTEESDEPVDALGE